MKRFKIISIKFLFFLLVLVIHHSCINKTNKNTNNRSSDTNLKTYNKTLNIKAISIRENEVYSKDSGKIYVSIDKINIYKNLAVDSTILTNVYYCETLELLGVITNESYTKIIKYHVKTLSGVIGFIKDINNVVKCDDTFSLNTKPFDIRGSWPMCYDPPNVILRFINKKKVICETIDYDEPISKETGTYTYNGTNRISASFKDTTIIIDVIEINGNIKLKIGCQIFDGKHIK